MRNQHNASSVTAPVPLEKVSRSLGPIIYKSTSTTAVYEVSQFKFILDDAQRTSKYPHISSSYKFTCTQNCNLQDRPRKQENGSLGIRLIPIPASAHRTEVEGIDEDLQPDSSTPAHDPARNYFRCRPIQEVQ